MICLATTGLNRNNFSCIINYNFVAFEFHSLLKAEAVFGFDVKGVHVVYTAPLGKKKCLIKKYTFLKCKI